MLSSLAKRKTGFLPAQKPTRLFSNSLFWLSIPFLAVIFVFSYLPLYGWSFAFFDYHPGIPIFANEFVGLKNFTNIIASPVLMKDIGRVLMNTLAMSFLGLLTSPLPIVFAIMLTEIRSKRFKRLTQTLTTLPNFISWILVYAVAFSMFSVGDGFINRLLLLLHIVDTPINFLGSSDNVWLTMLGYSVWKGLGWSSIIYLAAIAGIDQELYEAATVDGAGRFRLIWHITVPGVIPTFFVLLLLTLANLINNGMEQYFIFQNAMNKSSIEVLDLYVYNKGIAGTSISYATAISMLKSIISIFLLFIANQMSKSIRGEKII
jgi:putative aldouronate transport system permease protein